jgi:hypothetical protein
MRLKLLCAILLIAAGIVVAQPGEKPKLSIPEPTRKTDTRPTPPGGTFTITVVQYQIADEKRDTFPQAIPELVTFLRNSTDIETTFRWNKMPLGDRRIAQASILYMTGNDAILQIEAGAQKNLGDYLRGGGLLFGEDIRHSSGEDGLMGTAAGVSGTPFDRQFKDLVKRPQVLGGQGRLWRKLPRNHPLYSSYFDFPDGPPRGGAAGGNVLELEMLEVRGRPAVIFSDLNISWYWGDPLADGRQRGLQFGTNLVVFAMSQKAMNWR